MFFILLRVKTRKIFKIIVFGVTFDSKLQWGDHISSTVKKANTALHAIILIKHYFTPTELRSLITANFYAILFYDAEIYFYFHPSPTFLIFKSIFFTYEILIKYIHRQSPMFSLVTKNIF